MEKYLNLNKNKYILNKCYHTASELNTQINVNTVIKIKLFEMKMYAKKIIESYKIFIMVAC